MPIGVLDDQGAPNNISTTTDAFGNLVGSTCVTDPVTGQKLTVAQLHAADKQSLTGAMLYGAMGSNISLLIDPATGLADRQREAGAENVTATGLAACVPMIMAEIPVNSGTGTVLAIGPATITPVAMSGLMANPAGGPGWSIQVGTTIFYDVGGANQELVEVTAVTGTTFTATFSKTHSSSAVPMLVRAYYQARQAAGQPGVQSVSTEGHRAAYRYCVLGFGPVGTPTDIVVITGSATMGVRIKRVKITGQATAQASMPVQLVRRSTVGVLGGAALTGIAAAKHSSGDPAATCVVSTVGTANYTTLGTPAGIAGVDRLNLSPLGTGPTGSACVWDFATRNDKAIKLSGVAEMLCINLAGATLPAGAVLDIEIEVEEDNI